VNLRTLDLGENRITEASNREVSGLANLYGLRLAGNRLAKISGEMFTNNTNLHVLNLAHNRITAIEQEAMKNLKNLRALRLDNNQLKDMNGLVSSLKNLKWLNVSTNNLQWFDFAFIPKSLEWLDVHNNRIDKIGNYYHLSGEFGLQTLDMSFNNIRLVEEKTFLTSLRHIYLNNNKIGALNGSVFSQLGNLSRVELQGNEMTHLDMAALTTAKTGIDLAL
jgi:Leucine-rich repeat (LRR) protein